MVEGERFNGDVAAFPFGEPFFPLVVGAAENVARSDCAIVQGLCFAVC